MELGLFELIYEKTYGDGSFNENSDPFTDNYEEYDIFRILI